MFGRSISHGSKQTLLLEFDYVSDFLSFGNYVCVFLCSLVNTEVLSELISLITLEPPPDLEEKARFRLPHIAAEILSCEISVINEKVSSDPALLNQLYKFVEQEPPLNPLL